MGAILPGVCLFRKEYVPNGLSALILWFVKTGIFPGSFDPIHKGHIDIATRALKVVDKLYIAVLHSATKTPLFTVEERISFVREGVKELGNSVEVISFDGLLVDCARANGASLIIRGLRAVSDYEYETQLALTNRALASELETLFLVFSEKYAYVSSTIVKQVALLGGGAEKWVAEGVIQALKKKKAERAVG